MKKFLISFLILTGYCYSFDLTLWSSSLETMEFREEYSKKELFTESKIKPSAGLKFNCSQLSGIFSWSLSSAKWSQLCDYSASDFYDESKFNYALKFSPNSKNLLFPLEVYAGTIKTAQSASRIKSPRLNAINSLTKFAPVGIGLFPSLPSSSGTKEIFALGLRLFPQFFPQSDFYVSSSIINGSFSKNFIFDWCSLKLCLNGGFFSHSSSQETSWYLSQTPYVQDKYGAFCFEFNFDSSILSSSSSIYSFENPDGNPFFAVRSKNNISFGNFLFNFNFYYGDKDLITADGSRDKIKAQIQFNPQLQFFFNKLSVNTGICACADFRSQKDRFQEEYKDYSGKIGLSLRGRKFQLSSDAACNYSTLDENYEWIPALKFYWYENDFTSSTGFSAKIYDDESVYSAAQNFYFKQSFVHSVNFSSLLALVENQFKSSKNSIRFNLEFKNKNVKTCAYIEYVAVFYYNLINCNL